MSEQSTQKSNHFDLHVTGLGYANRFREIKPNRGKPFYCVDISAMHGATDDVQYTRFDCKIVGERAKRAIESVKDDINAGKAVLIGFKLSDVYVDTFEYKSGEKKGQQGVSLKSRLLQVTWMKVDGKNVDLPELDDGAETEAKAV